MGFAKVNMRGDRVWHCDKCDSTWAAPGGECAECLQTKLDQIANYVRSQLADMPCAEIMTVADILGLEGWPKKLDTRPEGE